MWMKIMLQILGLASVMNLCSCFNLNIIDGNATSLVANHHDRMTYYNNSLGEPEWVQNVHQDRMTYYNNSLGEPAWLQDVPIASKVAKYRNRRFLAFPSLSILTVRI